jgi:hypothetical protein
MSGTFFGASDDAPGGLNESTAAVREGLATAYSAVAADQREAHAFIVAHGAAAAAGHPDVRTAGKQGDPDPTLDAADA